MEGGSASQESYIWAGPTLAAPGRFVEGKLEGSGQVLPRQLWQPSLTSRFPSCDLGPLRRLRARRQRGVRDDQSPRSGDVGALRSHGEAEIVGRNAVDVEVCVPLCESFDRRI